MRAPQYKALRILLVKVLESLKGSGWWTYEEASKVIQGHLEAFFPNVIVGFTGEEADASQLLVCMAALQPTVTLIRAVRVPLSPMTSNAKYKTIVNIDSFDEVLALFDLCYGEDKGDTELAAFRAFAEAQAESDCYDPGHRRSYVCDVCRANALLSKYP